MCYKGQLDLINSLLCTFIVSTLLASGKWNRGNGIKGIALFWWNVKRKTKRAVWQRPATACPRARQCWDSWGCSDRNSCLPMLSYSPRFPVCLRRADLWSNDERKWFFTFVFHSFFLWISVHNMMQILISCQSQKSVGHSVTCWLYNFAFRSGYR